MIVDDAILAWADDEYVIGQQLATVTGMYGPDLEEAVAIGSIAQDHLGHALHLYRMLVPTDREVDRIVFERDAEAFRSCALAEFWDPSDWAMIVFRHLSYDLANRERQRWALEQAPDLTGLFQMMRRETDLHIAHWSEWVSVLDGQPVVSHVVEAARRSVEDVAASFFVNAPWNERLDAWREAVGEHSLDPVDADGRARDRGPLAALLATAGGEYQRHPDWMWGA